MRDWHWRFVERLVRTAEVTVLVPIYPLAPVGTADSVVPAVVGLARDVLRRPGRPVFVGGDSAGAGMALAVAQELAKSDQRALSGLVLVSPWVDVVCDDPGLGAGTARPVAPGAGLRAAGDAYRGPLPADHPWVSPIHGDLRGLPPMLVLSGTDDILNADAHRLAEEVTSRRRRPRAGRGTADDPRLPAPSDPGGPRGAAADGGVVPRTGWPGS